MANCSYSSLGWRKQWK